MNFGLDHYVPALKLKQGEKAALAALSSSVRQRITPLFQVTEIPEGRTLEEHLSKSFKGLKTAVVGLARFFIDPLEVVDGTSSRAARAAARAIFAQCRRCDVAFTPVSGISRDVVVTRAALRERKRDGFALRITVADFENERLPLIERFLRTYRLKAENVDVIVDLGSVEHMIDRGLLELSHSFLSALPRRDEWRTLTILSSSFPLSLKTLKNASQPFERLNWLIWREHLRHPTNEVRRPPTFGDWGIQHPRRGEPKRRKNLKVPGQIRYAQAAQWAITKGANPDEEELRLQMPRLAAQFVSGEHSAIFAGQSHCRGCSSIVASARGAAGWVAPWKWRNIGTTHHITTTVESILSLPES